jgi:hypothetical protein
MGAPAKGKPGTGNTVQIVRPATGIPGGKNTERMMNSIYSRTRAGGPLDRAMIPVNREVQLRSSCYPIPEFIREIVFLIGDKDLIPSVARVYGHDGLLFTLDISADKVLLDMRKLTDSTGTICFNNNYSIQINPVSVNKIQAL